MLENIVFKLKILHAYCRTKYCLLIRWELISFFCVVLRQLLLKQDTDN